MSRHHRSAPVRLRRGTRVRARGDGLLQVGSDPGRLAVVPDTTAVRGLLHLLTQGVSPDASPALPPLCAALHRAGVLVRPAEDELLSQARACTRVGLLLPRAWAATAAELLVVAGLEEAAPQECDVLLLSSLVTSGPSVPTSRSRLPDLPLVHLEPVDARLRVGPFTSPGRTACPECIETHLSTDDPWRRSPATAQEPPGGGRVDPGDVDLLALRLALTSITLDLVAWAEGREPLSWSSTRWFDGAGRIEHHRWEPHPQCGCAWDEAWGQSRTG